MGLRGVNDALRSLSELMGAGAPVPLSGTIPMYRRPVFEAPKDDAPAGDDMPDGMQDAAFNALAKDSELVKGDEPKGDEPEGGDTKPEEPAAKEPAEEPAAGKGAEKPKAQKGAEEPKAEKPVEEPPKKGSIPAPKIPAAAPPKDAAPAAKPVEEPPKEEPDKEGGKDAAPAKWRVPMDTVFGRTPKSDLERYLKTISATLQAQEGMSADQAGDHIDAVVGEMTKAKLLPPLRPDSSDEELDAWSDAAMARGLASVILDRA